jgi:hypothetical protein
MYYIYHIPGIKIGCSSEIDIRVESQGFNNYDILEEHFDIYVASKRERELQKQYGYKIDNAPYWMTIENQIKSRNKKSRIKAIKSRGIVKDVLSEMGKVGGNKNKESGKLLESAKKAWNLPRSEKQKENSKITFEKARLIGIQLKKKPIIATNVKTGKKIEFESTVQAASMFNDTNICNVLKGRYTQSKGYYYEYK